MVADQVCDDLGKDAGPGMDSERCINCGNFEDAIIRSNRATPREPTYAGRHAIVQEREDCSADLRATNHRRSYGRVWKANTCG